jgi:hypothetical protein
MICRSNAASAAIYSLSCTWTYTDEMTLHYPSTDPAAKLEQPSVQAQGGVMENPCVVVALSWLLADQFLHAGGDLRQQVESDSGVIGYSIRESKSGPIWICSATP